MLHRIKLIDFGPHKLLELDFTKGINLVVAGNGAGKSNIVYGIGWAIQGAKALPAEYGQSDIIRDGADSCYAMVEVDILGQLHRFTREYDGKHVSVLVEVDGKTVATSAAGTTAYLNQIGLDPHAFSVLCSRQRDLDAFVHSTPAQRKSLFDSLLRTGTIDDARKEARTISVALKDTIKESTVTEAEAQAIVHALTGKLEILVVEQESVQKEQDGLSAQIEGMRPNDEADGARRKIMGTLSGLRGQETHASDVMEQMHSLTVDDLRSMESIRADMGSVKELSEEHRHAMHTLEDCMGVARDRISNIGGQRQALEDLVSELETTVCPLCHTEGIDTEHAPDPSEHRSAELFESKYDFEHCETHLRSRGILMADVHMIGDDLDAELNLVEQREGYVRAHKEALDEMHRLADLIRAEEENLKQYPDPPDLSEMYELMERAQACGKVLLSNEGKIKFAELDLQECEATLERVRTIEKSYEEALERYAGYKNTTEALGGFRDYVLQEALVWVSDRMTHIMHEFGTFPEIVDGSRLQVDSKLHFYFMSGETRIPVYRFSGGQKAVFSIFLRVALSDYLTDRLGMNGLLILDAVFDSVDKDNVAAAAQALEAVGPTQAIIFSHFDVPELDANRITI